MVMSFDSMRYSATTSAAICFFVLLSSFDLTRAARVAITWGWGVLVTRRGSRERMLIGGGKIGFGSAHMGGVGGHLTNTGSMVPIGVGWRGPVIVIDSVSASNPRSYRSWATGGGDCWRYHASSKTAWWHDFTMPDSKSR